MIKQRRESVELYRKGNREELAAAEEAEIAVIERFLPAQMDDAEAIAAIQAIIAETGASSMKDMGRVMALVKATAGTRSNPPGPAPWSRRRWPKSKKRPRRARAAEPEGNPIMRWLSCRPVPWRQAPAHLRLQAIEADGQRGDKRTGHSELEVAHDGA